MTKEPPFRRVLSINEPVLVGAQWWQDELVQTTPDSPERRRSLGLLLGGSAALAVMGLGVYAAVSPSDDDGDVEARGALDMQRQHGWNLGSGNERLKFGGLPAGPVDRGSLVRLAADLAPRQALLRPFYVPALFQSAGAEPAAGVLPGSPPARPLKEELLPLQTFPMQVAYSRGRALASLLQSAPPGRAVIVDLPGPESVAFAAGLATVCDPVFMFDNWPHPRGVVPAHETLGAAWRLQARFVAEAAQRPERAPPALILDRNRLLAYSDTTDRFDNRYVVALPPADALQRLWVKEVIYVSPPTSPQVEMDDLNADFASWRAAGITLRMLISTDFDRGTTSQPQRSASSFDDGVYYYGGSADSHWSLWRHYAWGEPPHRVVVTPTRVYAGWHYVVIPRTTMFSTLSARPVGKVYVSASRQTGRVMAVGFRSGSLARAGRVGG